MSLVIFDFDAAITKRDTLLPLAHFFSQKEKKYHKLLFFYFSMLLYKLKFISDKQLKEIFLGLFVKGRALEEIDDRVGAFLKLIFRSLINDPVQKKLKEHVFSGDSVYIASANFDFLLYPLIKEWGLSGIISTLTEKRDNLYTGKIIGQTCRGEDKIKRLISFFGKEKLENAICYADSEDTKLLNSVKRGVIIPVK